MVKQNRQLYDALYELRDNLREKLKLQGNHQMVCTDDALLDMSTHKVFRLIDFLAIAGLDKDFIENYAHLFLMIIHEYTKQDIKKVKVSKEASFVLDRYKDRLTDLSKTNPNLYMGRIDKLRSYDLYHLEQHDDISAFVSLKKKQLILQSEDDTSYEHLTTLYRHINKDLKDLGTYHLYLAYPYIEGIYKKDMFPIKAPLSFMPVKLERYQKQYKLIFDEEKDIVFNRDLLLAVSKLEKVNLIEEMPDLSNLSKETILHTILPFYKKHGLDIHGDTLIFSAFKNELKDDFIKRHSQRFSLKGYMTFGRYQLFSSMIQKDMAKIIEDQTYNELLEGLIDEKHLYDQEKPLSIPLNQNDVNESGLVYINDINFSQEKVIEMVDREKKMVIWGPPGTGKSQTITSLIANQVLKGENVLVVSEKKVALDVIYNRLGGANKFVMMIDDASAKLRFYEKLANMFNQRPVSRTHNNDIYELENEIKTLDQTFNQAIHLMYDRKQTYKPLAYFYERYIKDKDIHGELIPKKVYQAIVNSLSHPNFERMESIEKTFDKDKKLRDFLDYHFYIKKYPWFYRVETKISRSSIIEFKVFIEALNTYVMTSDKAMFLKKRRLKKAFLEAHGMKLSFMSLKKSIDKKLLHVLMTDVKFRNYLLDHIHLLNKVKTNYDQLNIIEIDFLDMLITNDLFKNIQHIEKMRGYIFDAFFTGFLEDFKAKHQKYLFILDSYEKKMETLKSLIAEKRDVAKESFEMKLFTHALNFSNTKRIMDIKRILESDKKPSIKAFMDMFQLELFSHVKVWLMTPEAISSILPLKFNLYDLVIFDEASQMYVEKGIPAIYRAKKVVIAGDPKQLRPSALGMGRLDEDDSFEEDEILKHVAYDAKSLLDLARYKYSEALLNYHYRSRYQELIEFSNHAFYDGKLVISPNVDTPKDAPISYIYVKDATFDKKRNVEEAKEVIRLLKKILKTKKESESIGVITFNSAQRDLIMNEIDEELFTKSIHQKRFEKEIFRKHDDEDQSLFVKNIENVQGDERDIIIFSMGYAKDETGVVKRRFGWLNHEGGQNRLNVAITRAKKKIYFVSSLYPENLKVDDLSGRGPKLLKDFMRYCYYVSNKQHELAKEVLLSLYQSETHTKQMIVSSMVSDIKLRLERLGYHVEQSIGIGQFKMDLAIFDPKQQQYSLGIICDLSDATSFTARKELFHQEKFLASRGWRVIRVFHMHWYEQPNKVIKSIKDTMKSS